MPEIGFELAFVQANYPTYVPVLQFTDERKDYRVLGIWNKELAEDQDPPIKAVLAAQDYLKLVTHCSRRVT